MSLPRFIRTPRPTEPSWPRGERVDVANEPRCYCGAPGPLDVNGICVECWRVCVFAPAFQQDAKLRDEQTFVDEVAGARVRRDGTPFNIDTRPTSGGGITLDVDLGTPPRKP